MSTENANFKNVAQEDGHSHRKWFVSFKSSHIALPMKAIIKYLAKFHAVPATEDKSGPSIHTADVLCLV